MSETVKHSFFHRCENILNLKNDIKNDSVKDLSFYLSLTCLLDCHVEIKILFLNYCNKFNLVFNINEFKCDSSPRVRLLYVKSLKKQEDIKIFFKDPNKIIRKTAAELCKPCLELKTLLDDPCSYVRKAAVEKITQKRFLTSLKEKEMQFIFVKICVMMNDFEHIVRLAVSKSLRNFIKIKEKQLVEMTLKEIIIDDKKVPQQDWFGAFVYGFEDENEDIRINTIESMAFLAKTKKMAFTTFVFFMDMLNDEKDAVRIKASFYMMSLVKLVDIKIENKNLDWLYSNFEEKRQEIKDNLYKTLPYLIFEEGGLEIMLQKLDNLLLKNTDNQEIFMVYKILVKKYPQFFYDKLCEKLYKDENKTIESAIILRDVLIIVELKEMNYDVKLPEFYKKAYVYFKLKNRNVKEQEECKTKVCLSSTASDFTKILSLQRLALLVFIDALEKKSAKISEIYKTFKLLFKKKFLNCETSYFYKDLLKALKCYGFKGMTNKILRLFALNKIEFLGDFCLNKVKKVLEQNDFFTNNSIDFIIPLFVKRKYTLPIKIDIKGMQKYALDNLKLRVKMGKGKYYYYKLFGETEIFVYNYESNVIKMDAVVEYDDGSEIVVIKRKKIYIE